VATDILEGFEVMDQEIGFVFVCLSQRSNIAFCLPGSRGTEGLGKMTRVWTHRNWVLESYVTTMRLTMHAYLEESNLEGGWDVKGSLEGFGEAMRAGGRNCSEARRGEARWKKEECSAVQCRRA
jgi:hypothetical protein